MPNSKSPASNGSANSKKSSQWNDKTANKKDLGKGADYTGTTVKNTEDRSNSAFNNKTSNDQ